MTATCAHCGHTHLDTYSRNPTTGRLSTVARWCRDCYEQLAARAVRDAYDNNHLPTAEAQVPTCY